MLSLPGFASRQRNLSGNIVSAEDVSSGGTDDFFSGSVRLGVSWKDKRGGHGTSPSCQG
jgi:hypothetical protein